MDASRLYREGRRRITEVGHTLTPEQRHRPTPTCPLWTVKDVIGHLVGLAADVTAGRTEGVGTPPWTRAQVDARRDTPLEDVLAEWDVSGPEVEHLLDTVPDLQRIVFDLLTHEEDVRGVLGLTPAPPEAWDHVLQRVISGLGRRLDQAGVPALRLVADGQEWVVGSGPPGATVAASAFELWRALMGRRSRAQMAAFSWTGDPGRYLDELPLFEPPSAAIVEPAPVA